MVEVVRKKRLIKNKRFIKTKGGMYGNRA